MTAKVFLAGDHHALYSGKLFAAHSSMSDPTASDYVELTEGMLNLPIIGGNGEEIADEKWLRVYRSALRAMMSLDGFVSVVSFGATDGDNPKIRSPKREWGQIYFAKTGETVVSFSHDTRHSNAPFSALLEWVEDVPLGRLFDDKTVEKMLKKWSTVEVWREFFLGRIRQHAVELADSATSHRLKAESLENLSESILQTPDT